MAFMCLANEFWCRSSVANEHAWIFLDNTFCQFERKDVIPFSQVPGLLKKCFVVRCTFIIKRQELNHFFIIIIIIIVILQASKANDLAKLQELTLKVKNPWNYPNTKDSEDIILNLIFSSIWIFLLCPHHCPFLFKPVLFRIPTTISSRLKRISKPLTNP